MRLLAKLTGWPVLGIDYALAPEHKFPTQIAQIVDAVAQLGPILTLRPKQFALAGDSAGAHLALATALALRDAGERTPSALLLFYGLYGLRDSPSRRLWGGPVDGLDETSLAFFRDAYLPSPDLQHDPRYDLLTANLADLPPAFVTACALDPLLDDSRALAGLIAAAGGEAELKVYGGVLHGFLHLSRLVPTAMWALEDAARLLPTTAQGQSMNYVPPARSPAMGLGSRACEARTSSSATLRGLRWMEAGRNLAGMPSTGHALTTRPESEVGRSRRQEPASSAQPRPSNQVWNWWSRRISG